VDVGRPLPALKSLDRDERVLYCIRTCGSYLVVPEPLVAAFERFTRLRYSGRPTLEQRVVAGFMAAGYFARHLKRMRVLYGARRQALADSLHLAIVSSWI
jgi:GntR family transcriptional regulator/MocR family aminotransferase